MNIQISLNYSIQKFLPFSKSNKLICNKKKVFYDLKLHNIKSLNLFILENGISIYFFLFNIIFFICTF